VANAPHFNIEVLLDSLQGNFFARVAFSKIDFAESANTDPPTDDVPIERAFAVTVLEFHRSALAFHDWFC
jgi:hypothetical protein